VAIFRREPPECRWGIGRNRDSGLIAGYRRLLDVRSAKNIYRRRSWVYDTVGHALLAIDRLLDVRTTKWQKQLPTTMQCRSHCRRRTIECLFVTACIMDGLQHGPIRWREDKRKEFLLYAVVYLKPKQLIIKDCARRFVLKLYRHEASRDSRASCYFWNNSVKNKPISIIFDTQIPEETWHLLTTNFPTSEKCHRTT